MIVVLHLTVAIFLQVLVVLKMSFLVNWCRLWGQCFCLLSSICVYLFCSLVEVEVELDGS